MSATNFYTHPRDFLLVELEKRRSRNSSYSLRAFARDLDLAPSTLSEVISGHYGLSEAKALHVAKTLELTPDLAEYFVELFQQKFAKKTSRRRQALKTSTRRRNRVLQSRPLDSFHSIADWYHVALLEWITVQGRKITNDAKTIRRASKALKIESAEIHEALNRLQRVGSLHLENNEWHLTEEFTSTSNDIPSEAVRSFHKQIIAKAATAIEDQSLESREISSTVLSFSRAQMKEAKQALRDFHREFSERFGSTKDPDSVYCLGLQFFSLADDEGDSK